MLLEDNFEEIVRSNTREHGKTLAESRGDVKRGMEVVEFALGVPSLLMGEVLENIARGIDCEAIRQPLGVCVGITPFNFPAMVPLWMYPIAIACGNTFVLKPSEKVPLTAIKIAKLLEKAGLPKGVLNIVHGGREVVDALLTHPKVKAISFVGSTPIARYIYEVRHETRQARAVQRRREKLRHHHAGCRCGKFHARRHRSRVRLRRRTLHGRFNGGHRWRRGKIRFAHAHRSHAQNQSRPDRPRSAAGHGRGHHAPASRPRFGIDRAGVKEGAKIPADGRGVKVSEAPNGFYVGATILDHVQNGMTVAKEEIFGPVLNVMHMDDLDKAIELANKSIYGNGASIFTRSGKAAREFKHRVNCGMVGINIGVPASMAWFPFNGWNESFFGDLHMQGREGVQFFTQQKVTTSRWFSYGEGDIWHTEKK
jgi:malonate-semialdehyde dehydrogenase (acetylating)/methylmalonate-semialdehyde dehydrogenase